MIETSDITETADAHSRGVPLHPRDGIRRIGATMRSVAERFRRGLVQGLL
jgi:hypothetical protein